MSYHLYQTEGIILSSGNVGESNRYYHILTKDLGLVVAFAQAVRELKSKLRYHLQDFSHLTVEIIRGKEFWRLTSAEPNIKFENILNNKSKLAVFASISHLLKRFLHGEERDPELFSLIKNSLSFLDKEILDERELKDFEVLVVARILNRLGYSSPSSKISILFDGEINKDVLRTVSTNRQELLSEVNKALKESHL